MIVGWDVQQNKSQRDDGEMVSMLHRRHPSLSSFVCRFFFEYCVHTATFTECRSAHNHSLVAWQFDRQVVNCMNVWLCLVWCGVLHRNGLRLLRNRHNQTKLTVQTLATVRNNSYSKKSKLLSSRVVCLFLFHFHFHFHSISFFSFLNFWLLFSVRVEFLFDVRIFSFLPCTADAMFQTINWKEPVLAHKNSIRCNSQAPKRSSTSTKTIAVILSPHHAIVSTSFCLSETFEMFAYYSFKFISTNTNIHLTFATWSETNEKKKPKKNRRNKLNLQRNATGEYFWLDSKEIQ